MAGKNICNNGFAVMRWINDGNRLSVHSLKQVVEPKIPINQFKVGMCGVSLYKGYPGMWKFRILALGDRKEMKMWLDKKFDSLTADVTDSFCYQDEGIQEPTGPQQGTEMKVQTESSELKVCQEVPRKRTIDESPDRLSKTAKLQDNGKTLTVEDKPKDQFPVIPRKSPRKIPVFDASVENAGPVATSFHYLSQSGAQKDFPKETEKNFKTLEDEVRALRRRCHKLEDRVKKLEEQKPYRGLDYTVTSACSPTTTVQLATPSKQLETEQVCPKQSSFENLNLSNVSGEQNIFRFLCMKIFTEEEIKNGTRTGKKNAKCQGDVKPQLDTAKFVQLENLVMKHTSLDKTKFHKKFENLQKVLRKK